MERKKHPTKCHFSFVNMFYELWHIALCVTQKKTLLLFVVLSKVKEDPVIGNIS